MSIRSLYITNLGLLDNLGQTQILPYLEGLSKKGIKIHTLSFEKKENLKDTSYLKDVQERLANLDIEWTRLVYHRRWGNLLDALKGIVKTFNIVRNKDISLIHARASIPILIAWPVSKIFGCRIIYDRRGTMIGDFVDDVNVKNIFSTRFVSSLVNAIDRFIMKHSDIVIVLSKRALQKLKQDSYFSEEDNRIEHIPCCTDISRFTNTGSMRGVDLKLDGKTVVTYVGSLGTCYLFKEMCRFFKVLKQEKKNAIFLIVSHTDKKFIEDILKGQGLLPETDYVIFRARPDEVPVYLMKSDASLMIIKNVDCKIGSSPTKFGESLASGIPVIVNTGIGDTEDIIRREKVGIVIEDLNEDSYKKAVSETLILLDNKDGLKERCIETAKRYLSLDSGIERYTEIYTKLKT